MDQWHNKIQPSSGHKIRVPKKNLDTIQKKLLKQLPNWKIIKNLICLVDEEKFGNKRNRYVIPRNEVELTIKELHCKETAEHLGTDNTIEKIKSRFFWVNLSRDVKKFIREFFECQKFNRCKPTASQNWCLWLLKGLFNSLLWIWQVHCH